MMLIMVIKSKVRYSMPRDTTSTMIHLKLLAIVPGSEGYAIEFCFALRGATDNLIRRPLSVKKYVLTKVEVSGNIYSVTEYV